jgi:stearoyl-CoA 9-desaturase NADPH oxidoreductase
MRYAAPAQLGQVGAGIWRAAAAFTTPLLPDDYLTLVNPLWSARRARGQVDRVIRETEDAATLVIRPGWHWTAHRAGQWVMVGARIEGVWHSRAYSITSPADEAGRFSITVKAIDGGRVSHHLVHRATSGEVLRLAFPRGEFVLPDRVPARILFLTGGSGVTPVMGMLRTLAGGSSRPDVVHVHSARRPSAVIFGAELRALSRRLAGYRLHEQHTETDGRFTLGRLDELCPDWRQRPTWACGPAGQLADIEAHWEQAGAHDRLHVERFRPAFFAAPDADGGGSVTFTRTGREAAAPAGTPLLAVGEQAGVAMPSGCRMGICFSCVAPLRSGQVRDLRTGQVHGEEGELIQTCVSGAAGACAIDL